MLRALARWLERRRRNRAAVAAAVQHFEATTGQRPHAGMCGVIGEDDDGFVVRICHGQVIPPRRVWYRVGPEGVVAGELTFAQAEQFGERVWR